MRDGSVCDGSKIVASDFNALFYMEKIKRLEEELAAKNEVNMSYLYALCIYDTYVC